MITQNKDTLKLKSFPFTGTPEELEDLVKTLEFELKNCPMQGVGLSAIQIGIPVQVAIIRCGEGRLNVNLVNPQIVEQSQPFVFKGEGCLSFPDTFKNTKRFNQIKILNGDGKEIKTSGFEAVAIQHEKDHLEGITFIERAVS